MGMPACRISDTTEHGGTILVGFPEVLIGDLPASRIGDMHECPMVTPGVPPIPHVGGPFIMGSPTVLVGEMPQSRVTDQLVCVGPPDAALTGEFTVLVGMAGGAGAAGAGAGLQAAGVSVPAPASSSSSSSDASSSASQTKATYQSDGSVQTASMVPGKGLPPIPLQQPGWPDLPPENTATFSSVQPATVTPGTQLFSSGSSGQSGNSYWSTTPPTTPPTAASATKPRQMTVLTVQSPHGLKAWAGQPTGEPAGTPSALQVWVPPAHAQASGTQQRVGVPGATPETRFSR